MPTVLQQPSIFLVHCAHSSLCTHGRCQQYCSNLQYSCSLCILFSMHSRERPTVLQQPSIFLFIVHIVLCALTGDANSIAATFNIPVHCAHCSLCTHGRCPTVLQQPSIFLFIVQIVFCALTGDANSIAATFNIPSLLCTLFSVHSREMPNSIAATFNIPVHCAHCSLCTQGRCQQYCSNLQYSCSLCTLFSMHSREMPTVLQQPSIFLFIMHIALCALTGDANSIAATFNIPVHCAHCSLCTHGRCQQYYSNLQYF